MADTERIKDAIDLRDLVGQEIALSGKGSGAMKALCPFKPEKNPSFMVWDDHYHCFGCHAHGDVFTWLMERGALTFRDALKEAAKLSGVPYEDDPLEEERHKVRRARADLYRQAAGLYHDRIPPEVRAYLNGRGFTDDFLCDYKIGYGAGGVAKLTGASTEELRAAGLVKEDGRDTLDGRVVFPIWGRQNDEIVGFQGRAFPPDRKPKFIAVPEGPSPLVNERGLRDPGGRDGKGRRYVYLCEGDTDTALMVQAGCPVVGVRGSNGLQDEHAAKLAQLAYVLVCADGDDGGRKLVRAAGAKLGNKACIVPLPEGKDIGDLLAAGADPGALAAEALPYVDWLLRRIPKDVTPSDAAGWVDEAAPALLLMGKVEQEAYLKRLAKALRTALPPVREQVKALGEAQRKLDTPDRPLGIVWVDRKTINPVQFIHDDVMHTTVLVPTTVEEGGQVLEKLVPTVVSGLRQTWPLTPEEAHKRGLEYSKAKVPVGDIIRDRWRRTGSPYALRQYLSAGAAIDQLELFREVRAHYVRYVDFPDERYADYLALWTMGTYFFALHHGYPYTHLTGPKRSGKTLTMDITRELAFNAVGSSSMSVAAMYRTIEAYSPTVLLDEAEQMHNGAVKKAKEQAPDDRMEILKAGYKPGSPAIRCAGDDHNPVAYDVYSPKMFGSIAGVEAVLGDRMIPIHMARKRKGVILTEYRPREAEPLLHATRDRLYCFMLENGGHIAALVDEGIDQSLGLIGDYVRWNDLRDRDREIWMPVLVMAAFIDTQRDQEVDTDREQWLMVRMLRLAQDATEEKRGRDAHESNEVAIVEGLLEYTQLFNTHNDWYGIEQMVTWLHNNIDSLRWMEHARHIYPELEKVRILLNRDKQVTRKRYGPNGTQVTCVLVTQAALEDAAERIGARRPDQR